MAGPCCGIISRAFINIVACDGRYLRIVLRSDFQNQGSRNASTSEEVLERSFLPSFARLSQSTADRALA